MTDKKIYINAVSYAYDTEGIETLYDIKSLRRLDNFTKLALKAAKECLFNAGLTQQELEDCALIISTGYGPVTRTCDFMNSIINDGDLCASPLAFSSSVHNAALTQISILLELKGPCLTISNLESSFESALSAAQCCLKSGMAKKVLIGAVDEIHNVAQKVLQTNPEVFKDITDKTMRAGAAFFLLSYDNEGKELAPAGLTATPLDPSRGAFNLAHETQNALSKKDVQKMVSDLVKTELARRGADIMNVFENRDVGSALDGAGLAVKASILGVSALLFSADCGQDADLDLPTVDSCYNQYKKNKLVTFFTSGSTGIYKNCVHTDAIIKEERDGVCFLFKDIKRVFCTVPVHHSYGFAFGLQMPKELQLPVFPKPPLPFEKWNELLKEGDLLIAFPMFLKQLMSLDFKFPAGVTVLSSTAPCPDELIEKLKENGAMRFIEIYGASEGGAIGWREEAFAPFTLLPFWQGQAKDGVLETIKRKNTDMRVEMPDIVEVFEDGRFKPSGRKDNAVQVAGINVYPQKIEKIIKQYEAVADAVVRLMRASEGERLKTFIILKEGYNQQEVLPLLRAYMQQKLTAHEMPRSITFGKEIPVTAFGKKKDW